jgi:hypothetical protein
MLGSNGDLPYSLKSSIVNYVIDRPLDQSDNSVFFVLCEVCFRTASFIRLNRLADLDKNGCSNCKEKQFFVGYPANK